MHQLFLKNVGPIKNCEVSITDFNVFTGAQASGKSTIAKSVFFFRTVKDDIFNAIMKRNAMLFENSSLYKTLKLEYVLIFFLEPALFFLTHL